MDIQNQILEFAEKHSLKEKALASIDEVMDASIESDNEIGIDFLDGNDRADLIFEFGRFEFQIDRNDNCKIVTKINIYSKNFTVQISMFLLGTMKNGQIYRESIWTNF